MTSSHAPAPPGFKAVFPEAGFNAHVGPVFHNEANGEFRFTVRPEHLNGGAAIHGGMLMALTDIVMGRTVNLALEGASASTVSLNCDFIGPVKEGETILARANITRRTRSIVFISATLSVGERTVMTATGLWKILGEA